MVERASVLGFHFEVRRCTKFFSSTDHTPSPTSSGIIRFIGLFFPVFYLQLYAITRGVDPELAFYAVSRSHLILLSSSQRCESLALGPQRCQHLRSNHTRRDCTQSRIIQPRNGIRHWNWHNFVVDDSSERSRWNDDIRYSPWLIFRCAHCLDACDTRQVSRFMYTGRVE